MGDSVSGIVRVGKKPTAVVIEITCKKPVPKCLDDFKQGLEKLALDCGCEIRKFTTTQAPRKKAAKK